MKIARASLRATRTSARAAWASVFVGVLAIALSFGLPQDEQPDAAIDQGQFALADQNTAAVAIQRLELIEAQELPRAVKLTLENRGAQSTEADTVILTAKFRYPSWLENPMPYVFMGWEEWVSPEGPLLEYPLEYRAEAQSIKLDGGASEILMLPFPTHVVNELICNEWYELNVVIDPVIGANVTYTETFPAKPLNDEQFDCRRTPRGRCYSYLEWINPNTEEDVRMVPPRRHHICQ